MTYFYCVRNTHSDIDFYRYYFKEGSVYIIKDDIKPDDTSKTLYYLSGNRYDDILVSDIMNNLIPIDINFTFKFIEDRKFLGFNYKKKVKKVLELNRNLLTDKEFENLLTHVSSKVAILQKIYYKEYENFEYSVYKILDSLYTELSTRYQDNNVYIESASKSLDNIIEACKSMHEESYNIIEHFSAIKETVLDFYDKLSKKESESEDNV